VILPGVTIIFYFPGVLVLLTARFCRLMQRRIADLPPRGIGRDEEVAGQRHSR
jgi:hypothetical protein